MKLLKYITFISIAILAMSSCSSSKNIPKSQLADKWVLKTMNNRNASQIFTDKIPFVIFNVTLEQISGNGGCNTFSGKYTYNGGTFHAPNLAATQMACMGNNEEPTFFKLLSQSSKISIMNGDLVFSQNDQPVLVFSRAKPLSSTDLLGIWKLQTINGKSVDLNYMQTIPTLEFNFAENRINGTTGCNNYNAPFNLSKNVLDVKPFVMTRMACNDMDKETEFVNTLNGQIDIDIEGTSLVLRKDKKTIMTFQR